MRFLSIVIPVLCAAAVTTGCARAKSANPLSPDIAGPIPNVAITAPKPLEPPQGGQVVNKGTPITLTAENATSSGQRALFMRFEVASDVNFQQVLPQADRVEPGADGRTRYRLPEPLGTGYTYYWRSRADDGANVGPYSFTSSFSIIDDVVIETPTPVEPAGKLATNRPVFRVRNGRISGTTEAYYRFEVGTAADPSAIAAVVTATPGANGETTISLGELPWAKTLYWRVYGSDGTTRSPYSAVVSFTTPAAPPPPPAPTPVPPPIGGGGGGGGTGGGGRTPDPPPGGRLPLPNMSSTVSAVANQYPSLLFNSCQEHGGTWGFMDTLVNTLRQTDTRWGYNWKRGNVGDPSLDVVDYHYGAGVDEGSTEVYISDVIGSHCSSNPTPVFNDVTPATIAGGGIGRWTGRGRF
jgi:hypothetical protein